MVPVQCILTFYRACIQFPSLCNPNPLFFPLGIYNPLKSNTWSFQNVCCQQWVSSEASKTGYADISLVHSLRSELRTSNYKAELGCQLGKLRGSGCLLGWCLLLPQLDLHKFLNELDENCANLGQANIAQKINKLAN